MSYINTIKQDNIVYDIKDTASGYATTTQLNNGLATKQNTLTAGENITITAQGVISATGGGGSPDEIYIGSVAPIGTQELWIDTSNSGELSALANVAFTGNYNDLSNKPTIPTIPTNISSFENDAGYLTAHQSLTNYATKSWVENKDYLTSADIENKVDKVEGKGLSTNDYDNTAKAKVDAIPANPQYTDTTYTAGSNISITNNVISATGTTYTAGSNISITNNVISATDTIYDDTAITGRVSTIEGKEAGWDAKSDFSGNYNDLTNKPTIPVVPTNVSSFTNDAGYLTLATLPVYNGGIQ